MSVITDRGPVAFFIPKDSEKYLDFNKSLMHLWVKMTSVDVTNLANDTDVGLINYQFNTILSQCDVTKGAHLGLQSSTTHTYKVITKTLVNFYEKAIKSQYSASLFYNDMVGATDSQRNGWTESWVLSERQPPLQQNPERSTSLGSFTKILFSARDVFLNFVNIRIELTCDSDTLSHGTAIFNLQAANFRSCSFS